MTVMIGDKIVVTVHGPQILGNFGEHNNTHHSPLPSI